MESKDLQGILTFLRESERLKSTHRSSNTSIGRRESVAEYTSAPPIISSIRKILNEETRQNAEKSD